MASSAEEGLSESSNKNMADDRTGSSTGQSEARGSSNQGKKLPTFKTGGMRGIMKNGYDGINEMTCNILGTVLARRYASIVIGYDQRNNSEKFAQIAAAIFLKHGKHAAVFKHCTTPYLAFESASFDIGLMITASHNSREYNGFKVYANGAQIVEPMDRDLEWEMQKLEITDLAGSAVSGARRGESILGEVRQTWTSRISSINYKRYFESFGVERPGSSRFTLCPVFSALHGVSGSFMAEACRHFGMKMDLSSTQNTPDGDFGGISHPNPEIASNYDTFTQADEDITVFMCDPDGDRFGLCMSRMDSSGRRVRRIYNGDEIAMVLFFYLYKRYPHSRICLVNTFLCGSFFSALSQKLGIPHFQTEIGFKHVSKAVREFYRDAGADEPIILAYEDPLGFLIKSGSEKDGVKAAVIMYFILQEYELDEIFGELSKFGLHSTHTVHIRVENPKFALQTLLARLKYTIASDRYIIHTESFKTVFRISGTEPLIKIYTMSETLEKDELVEKADGWIAENVHAALQVKGG